MPKLPDEHQSVEVHPEEHPTAGHHVELVMGTAVTFDIRDPFVPAGAVEEAVAWLHHVDEVFSPYKPDSPISKIGRGELARADASEDVRQVLAMCDKARFETAGAFDVFALPSPNGTNFDPCGMVKGWSIEVAARIIESWSADNFSINAGGDIVLRGSPVPDSREPWPTGIRHPYLADQVACVLHSVGRLAVATSGTYERGAHLIDPRTGQPVDNGLVSVTVVGPDLTWVDTYATAVFVLGLDSLTWLHNHPDYGAFAITTDGTAYSTPVFDQYRQLPAG